MAILHSIKLQITYSKYFFSFSKHWTVRPGCSWQKSIFFEPKNMPQQVTITTNHTVFKDMLLKQSKQYPQEPPFSTTVFLPCILFWQVYSFKIHISHTYVAYYLATKNKEEKHNCLSTDGCSNIIALKCLQGMNTFSLLIHMERSKTH